MSKIIRFTPSTDCRDKGIEYRNLPDAIGRSLYLRRHVEDDADGILATALLVSVVVPTCDRPELLNRCIASLVLQQFDTRRFEIIVVDDAPNAATRQVVTGWAAHTAHFGPALFYLPSPGSHGPAAARNRGWRMARGPVVAFTDDDAVAGPHWLKSGLEAFRPGVRAVCGRVVMPLSGTPTDYELQAKEIEQAEFVSANCFCEKSLLEELQGFDERFQFAGREDADFYFRALDANAAVVRAPSAIVVHPIRPAKWGVSLLQQKAILSDALLFKKHPTRFREKISPSPRWDFYAIVAALLVMMFGLVDGDGTLVAGAGAIWLALTARLCLRRLRHTARTASHIGEMLVTSALIPPAAVFWRIVGAFKFRVPFI